MAAATREPTVEQGHPLVLIAIEGIGGAGKTTLADRLEKWLKTRRLSVVRTKEPGGTGLGLALREILLNKGGKVPMTDALLFAADRAQTYSEVIRPALKKGKIVISDRNLYGLIAYQGFGFGLPLEVLDELNRLACQGLYPDLILVLDTPPTLARRRIAAQDVDRFDRLGSEFQSRVRAGYLYAAKRDPEIAHVIDASAPLEDVVQSASQLLSARLRITQRPSNRPDHAAR